MKNLVSIALTTWNGERFLKQQLDSILNQSYRNIEIIIRAMELKILLKNIHMKKKSSLYLIMKISAVI